MQSVFVIFDIDKTLLKTSNAHMLAYQDTFKEIYTIDTGIDVVEHHGRTELWIIPEVLKLYELEDSKISKTLPLYFVALERNFQKRFADEQPEVLPGVVDLLTLLQAKGTTLAVVTGNSEGIARTKLTKAGLNNFLSVGAFGNEDVDRTKLVNLAKTRAESLNKRSYDRCVLFGDAPPDMQSGKAAGFKAVGVTTGNYSSQELKNTGADIVIDDLQNTIKIENLIKSLLNL